ncbi:putative Uncharacterized ABC transporter ATP-binding protein HI_1087 [Azospirillaceae bacterium]
MDAPGLLKKFSIFWPQRAPDIPEIFHSNAAIHLQDVTYRHDRRDLLSHISFEVFPGRILVVTGGDGCGKTVLLNIISTLFAPTSGRLRILGQDIETIDEEERSRLRLNIGVMFEEGGLLDGFSVQENMELPLARRGVSRDDMKSRAETWLDTLQLTEYRDYLPNQLSTGLIRRVGLARALVCRPSLLICDKPTSGLDFRTVSLFRRLFQSLRTEQGVTVVLATNDPWDIEHLADDVLVLDKGKPLYFGTPSSLRIRCKEDQALQSIFADL